MIDIEKHRNDPIFHALEVLNQEMVKNDYPPIELNVVGGFALMLYGHRNPSEYTDIDFVGVKLTKELKSLSEDVGKQTGMVKDLECSTGPLHFEPAYSMEKIAINIIDERDLLKLKLIAIDTALVEIENNVDFTRGKDLKDIGILLKSLGMTVNQAINENRDYIIDDNTGMVVQTFIDNNYDMKKSLEQIQEKLQYNEYLMLKDKFESPGKSLLDDRGVSGMLDDLFSR